MNSNIQVTFKNLNVNLKPIKLSRNFAHYIKLIKIESLTTKLETLETLETSFIFKVERKFETD